MTIVKLSFEGNPFEHMSEEDKEILNLGLNLMAMPEDHPHYKTDSEKLDKLLKEKNVS